MGGGKILEKIMSPNYHQIYAYTKITLDNISDFDVSSIGSLPKKSLTCSSCLLLF